MERDAAAALCLGGSSLNRVPQRTAANVAAPPSVDSSQIQTVLIKMLNAMNKMIHALKILKKWKMDWTPLIIIMIISL